MLVDVPRRMTAYFARRPDPAVSEQRVAFGTSGHRGSAFDVSFNEHHILATYKLYAETFRGSDHLRRLQEEAQALVQDALRGGS
jgi:phosphoglucomutase